MSTKLTLKQTKFVSEYIRNGGNGTQAVLKTYDTDPRTARSMAAENLAKPSIYQKIEEALLKNNISAEFLTGEIKGLAAKEVDKISGDVKLKSLIELLKLMGAYPSTKHTTLNVSFKGKLKEMKYQDLKTYVEGMRQENDEIIQEVQELEIPNTEAT